MKNSKKILIITSEFPPQPGGIGNHAYHLALYLFKENYPVTVIADQRSKTGKEEADFDKELPFTVVRIKRYAFRIRMYFNRLIATYKSFGKASNVIATGKFSLWNISFLSSFFNVQTLAIIHGSEVNFKSFFLKKSINIALKKMDVVIAVSEYTKRLVSHLNREVTVIPNGINLKEWEVNTMSTEPVIGEPALVTVGRVSDRKGQYNVIKQLPELLKKYPKLHYHCIGIPSKADEFMKGAKALSVESHVTFHGCLDHEPMKQIIFKSDIFVMLSSESEAGDVEGYGIAILEANALGVPAIGSINCGIEDAINPNSSGILIELNNPVLFKSAITSILQDKTNFKNEAIRWAEIHNWSNIINQFITLIK